jgi:hypothetical protein
LCCWLQAIDPDNTDGYQANAPGTGFATTAAETLDFLTFLSAEARAQGMAIGLKNTLGLIAGNVQLWDFAVNEQCYNYKECDYYIPFQTGAHLLGYLAHCPMFMADPWQNSRAFRQCDLCLAYCRQCCATYAPSWQPAKATAPVVVIPLIGV